VLPSASTTSGHVREDVGELTAALDRPAACVIDNIVGALPPQFGRGRSHSSLIRLVGLKRSLVSRWDR